MVNVIGVRFRQAGKVYYFSPGEAVFQRGDHVIVETARGVEYGEVILGNHEVDEIKVVQPLRPIIRPANEEDTRHEEENREKQKEAFQICREKIRRHQLDMKLIDCEFTFDNSKILFYFTADGRIDFRELVKDLASVFRTRIELRQVGVRDETKLLGGIGVCGRPLCCHSYLSDFIPVSIKMAKEQNLSLNPTKISGVCGRLMCCLKNEEDVYESLNRKLPNIGDYVTTSDGLRGSVSSVSILKQQVKVVVTLPNDEKEVREYPAEELEFKPRQRRDRGKKPERGGAENAQKTETEDEKELEKLEQLEQAEDAGSETAPAPSRRASGPFRKDRDGKEPERGGRNRRGGKRSAGGGQQPGQSGQPNAENPDGRGGRDNPGGQRRGGRQGSEKRENLNPGKRESFNPGKKADVNSGRKADFNAEKKADPNSGKKTDPNTGQKEAFSSVRKAPVDGSETAGKTERQGRRRFRNRPRSQGAPE